MKKPRSEAARLRQEVEHMDRCIDLITLYVIRRSQFGKRGRPPSHVFSAARIVRYECNPAALEIVLDWICSCRTRAPFKVGAAAWDLGGPVLAYFYPKHGHLLKRTAA